MSDSVAQTKLHIVVCNFQDSSSFSVFAATRGAKMADLVPSAKKNCTLRWPSSLKANARVRDWEQYTFRPLEFFLMWYELRIGKLVIEKSFPILSAV